MARRPRRERRATPPPRRPRRQAPTLALGPLRHSPPAVVHREPDVAPPAAAFDIGAHQARAESAAQRYVPMYQGADDVRSAVDPTFASAVSDLTGEDVGAGLGELQQAAQSILDVAGDVLGIDVSPGFSGGVDAREAQYIYSGRTILEEQTRLADIEGTRGTKELLTDDGYVDVGGRGRGGPGFSDLHEDDVAPAPRARRGRFAPVDADVG